MLVIYLVALSRMVFGNWLIANDAEEINTIKECLGNLVVQSAENMPIFMFYDNDMANYIPEITLPQLKYNCFENVNCSENYYYSNHVLLTENVRGASRIFEKYRTSNFYNFKFTPKGKFFIFSKEWTFLDETVKYFWNNSIINLVFVNATEVFTTYPYWNETNCGETLYYKRLGNCRSNIELHWERFPNNLKNCTLNAALFGKHIRMPYLDDTNLHSKRTGIFIEPLRLLISKYHLKINYIIPDDDKQLKKTLEGSKAFLKEMYGCVYDLLIVEPFRLARTAIHYEASEIIFFETNVWITPSPKQLSKITVLFSLFQLRLWLLWLFTLITVAVLIWGITKYELIESFSIVCSISIGISVPRLPKSGKCLLLFYLIYSLHVTYFFQGKLSSVLTKPNYEQPINSFERLAYSNLHIVFYYELNMQTLQNSYNPFASLLLNKSLLYEANSYNPAELVFRNENYSSTAFAHYSDISEAHKQKVQWGNVVINNYFKILVVLANFFSGYNSV